MFSGRAQNNMTVSPRGAAVWSEEGPMGAPCARSEIIRAGVAGAGVFGRLHARKYADLEGVRLSAVFDVDASRAEALADAHGAEAFTDYSDFLDAVDVVTIATPATTHFDLARRALAVARPCLVEKPLAVDPGDAEALVNIARSAGVPLQVGHQERFVAEAAGLFDGVAGLRRAAWRRRGPGSGRCEDVSVVFDLMIHDLDLARRLTVGEPIAVRAEGDAHAVAARLEFVGGVTLDFDASRRAEGVERTMALTCADGARVYDFAARRWIRRAGAAAMAAQGAARGGPSTPADPLGLGVARFIAAARGLAPAAVPGEEAVGAVRWAAMIEDARLGAAYAGGRLEGRAVV